MLTPGARMGMHCPVYMAGTRVFWGRPLPGGFESNWAAADAPDYFHLTTEGRFVRRSERVLRILTDRRFILEI